MEEEDDDDEDGSAGAGRRAAGSEGGWASSGGDCGWEGETRGRSGGTEKGSERAALGGNVVRGGDGDFGDGVVNSL